MTFKVYRPVKTNYKTQDFAENKACIIPGVRPFKFVPCGTPGSVSLYPEIGLKGHNGEDWHTYHKEPIYFPVNTNGIRWQAETHLDSAGAVTVTVRSVDPIQFAQMPAHIPGSKNMIEKTYRENNGKLHVMFVFSHLHSSVANNGKSVKFGDLLGYADSTGASSGDHLHWSMKISDNNSWFFIDGDNGYAGAIDFSPYFENRFVLDVLTQMNTGIQGDDPSTVEALKQRVISLAKTAIALLRQRVLALQKKNPTV